MLLLTVPVPMTLSIMGDFENGQIIGEYFGTLLLGAAGLAVGQFISSVTSNQISAFIFSVIGLLFITMIGEVSFLFNIPGWIADFFSYLSFSYHFESLKKGLLDTRDLIYFMIITLYFLYLNTKVIEIRK